MNGDNEMSYILPQWHLPQHNLDFSEIYFWTFYIIVGINYIFIAIENLSQESFVGCLKSLLRFLIGNFRLLSFVLAFL